MMCTEREKSPGVGGSDYSNRDLTPDEQSNDLCVRPLTINPGPCLYPYQLVEEGVAVTGSCEGLVNSLKRRRRPAVAFLL